ncbi:MAG: sigma-70 family RNA polymerase sigma factor [Spirochaetes bacterium]|nr:sigma-70 family RNA polymerase sigma factor [Spirochaetota bacterium]
MAEKARKTGVKKKAGTGAKARSAKAGAKTPTKAAAAPVVPPRTEPDPQVQEARSERDEKVQALLPDIFKKKPEALAEFFEVFSDDIYNFPMRMFRFNEDEASEFYLYAFEHLRDGRKISSFQGKAKFTTWFYAVLRNLTIDFLRSQKDKMRFTTYLKADASGKMVDAIESVSDTREQNLFEETLFEQFNASLTSLAIPQRVLFKLAYAWYFELNAEELEYLTGLHKKSPGEILSRLQDLKKVAHERSVEVRELEEKLTANFQGISVLETRVEAFFRENPDIEKKRETWSEEFFSTSIPPQITDMIQSLMKKKKKQQSLLLHQKKSLLSIRVPYKDLGELLQSTQGVLSVQLIRIVEKLSQSLTNTPAE